MLPDVLGVGLHLSKQSCVFCLSRNNHPNIYRLRWDRGENAKYRFAWIRWSLSAPEHPGNGLMVGSQGSALSSVQGNLVKSRHVGNSAAGKSGPMDNFGTILIFFLND